MATIELAPGKRDQVAPRLTPPAAHCLKDDGTLDFKVMIARDDDAKVLIYEVFRDDAPSRSIGTGPPSRDGERRPPE